MVEKVYKTFDAKRKTIEAIEADEQDLIELKQIEEKVKSRWAPNPKQSSKKISSNS